MENGHCTVAYSYTSTLKTGLFFGSFNPIHIGHLALANYFVEFTDLEQVWFVVSPHNPFKEKNTLLDDHHRLAMVNLAVEDDARFKVSNIEFKLPQPNYTVHTLAVLSEKHPDRRFSLIMGADNLQGFPKWKNYETILQYYSLYVYPRPGCDGGILKDHPGVHQIAAPMMEVSASFIRESVRNGKDIRYFMPEKSYRFMREMHFYEK